MLKRYREAYCSNIVRPGEKGKSFRQIYGNKAEELEPNEEESKYIDFAKQYFKESHFNRRHAMRESSKLAKEMKLAKTLQEMLIDYLSEVINPTITGEELKNFAKARKGYYFSSLSDLSDYEFDGKIDDATELARLQGYICNCGDKYWFDPAICETPKTINDDDDE